MIVLLQKRFRTGPDGTFGEITDLKGNHLYFTIECEWLNNKPFVSCVSPGWYDTEWYHSSKRGLVLQLQNVLDYRDYCQYHRANWAYQLEGCTGLGDGIANIYSKSQKKTIMGVTNTTNSMKKCTQKYRNEKIRMIISNEF